MIEVQPTRFAPTEPFRPATGLESPHAQTIFGSLFRPRRRPKMERERWTTSDGDFIEVDILEAPRRAPTLFILHGMEGSSRSGYVAELLVAAAHRGWGAFAFNFRSCSGVPNRLARSYHFGASEDPAWALGRIRERRDGPLFGVGFSLGGNVLLRVMGEQGASSALDRAVAISVPFDVASCARALDAPGALWPFVYRTYFLRSLVPKALAKARAHPSALDAARIRRVRTVRGFDDVVTAPIHGFAGAADYYARTSSSLVLDKIARPTLIVSAGDDPFLPNAIPPAARENPRIAVLETERGGHVGFVAGRPWRPRFWAEAQAIAFLETSIH